MRRLLVSVPLLVLVATAACSNEPRERERAMPEVASAATVARVVPHEAAELMEEPGTLVLDVRTEAEWSRGHLPGAVRVGIDRLPRVVADGELPAESGQPIVVYCTVGSRSARAAELLASRGYTAVHDLHGGIRAWSMSGLPVER